jgi:hypothetical protein
MALSSAKNARLPSDASAQAAVPSFAPQPSSVNGTQQRDLLRYRCPGGPSNLFDVGDDLGQKPRTGRRRGRRAGPRPRTPGARRERRRPAAAGGGCCRERGRRRRRWRAVTPRLPFLRSAWRGRRRSLAADDELLELLELRQLRRFVRFARGRVGLRRSRGLVRCWGSGFSAQRSGPPL